MNLALLRHLPTRFNQAGLLQGRLDEPILAPGPELTAEIAHTRRRLQQETGFEQVLVSRLRRTAMTAGVYGYHERARVEPLLDELDFGPYEAGPRTDMLQALGAAWHQDPGQLQLGESIAELEDRVALFLDRYRDAESVLAFGHGAWIRACLSLVRHGSIARMNQLNVANNELILLVV